MTDETQNRSGYWNSILPVIAYLLYADSFVLSETKKKNRHFSTIFSEVFVIYERHKFLGNKLLLTIESFYWHLCIYAIPLATFLKNN